MSVKDKESPWLGSSGELKVSSEESLGSSSERASSSATDGLSETSPTRVLLRVDSSS